MNEIPGANFPGKSADVTTKNAVCLLAILFEFLFSKNIYFLKTKISVENFKILQLLTQRLAAAAACR